MRFTEIGRVVLRVELLEHRAMPSNLFSELQLTELLDWCKDPFSNYWLWSDEDSASRLARIAADRSQPLDNEEHSARTTAGAMSALMPSGTVDHSTSTAAATVGALRMSEFERRSIPSPGEGAAASPMSGLSVTAHIYGDGPAEDCIPVNANNDNGSAWVPNTSDTVPSRRDFSFDGPLNTADPQLRRINVGIVKDDGNGGVTGALGTLNISVTANGVGRARIWKDNIKTAPFQPLHVKFGGTAWIEGTHESRPERDVTINVDFTPDDAGQGEPVHLSFAVSITPIISQMVVIPAPSQNINFVNPQQNALNGLGAGQPLPFIDGARFSSYLIDYGIYDATNPAIGMDYVQNVTQVANGINRIGQRDAAGWTFIDGSPALNKLPVAGLNLPLLDSHQGSMPYYHLDLRRTVVNNLACWTDTDSPQTGSVPNAAFTLRVDVKYTYTIHLVCRFGDGSLYPVANTGWTVNYYSTFNQILDPDGVKWSGQTNFNNDLPARLAGPIANGNILWR